MNLFKKTVEILFLPQNWKTMIETKGCIRMWATKGETLATNYYPNNCYDEARGDKKTVY